MSTRLLYGTIRHKVGTFHENRKEHVCALRTFKSSLTGKMIFFKRLRTNTILVRDFTVYTHTYRYTHILRHFPISMQNDALQNIHELKCIHVFPALVRKCSLNAKKIKNPLSFG